MSELEKLYEYPEIVKEFANYKLSIQMCSNKTVSEYLLDLRSFMRYIIASRRNNKFTEDEMLAVTFETVDIEFFRGIKRSEIMDFLGYMQFSRGNHHKATARKLSAIKAIYKYFVIKMRYFEDNPTVGIDTPKLEKKLPKFLNINESLALLNAVKTDESSKTRLRDYAMITLFLNCGMRLSELVGISLADVDDQLRSLRVLGKGAKERVIYLNDACADAIKTYIPERQAVAANAAKQDNALFLSSRGTRISNKTVQYVVGKYLKAAGLEVKHYSTHKLRHTAATLMYQTGEVDIRVLKDILGHEQLNTTQIYTHVSNSGMEDAMRKNPLAEIEGAKANTMTAFDEISAESEDTEAE